MDRISLLILKKITSSLSTDEAMELETWIGKQSCKGATSSTVSPTRRLSTKSMPASYAYATSGLHATWLCAYATCIVSIHAAVCSEWQRPSLRQR